MANDNLPAGLPPPLKLSLPSGLAVTIRPIRPDDAPLLQASYRKLSAQSIYLRFFRYAKELTDQEARHLASVDYHARMAFVATVDDDDAGERIVGVARYEVRPAGAEVQTAECAVVVGDRYQRQGVGRALLRQLAAFARTQGVHAFAGTVLETNTHIMRFVERSGLSYRVTPALGGVFEVTILLDPPSADVSAGR